MNTKIKLITYSDSNQVIPKLNRGGLLDKKIISNSVVLYTNGEITITNKSIGYFHLTLQTFNIKPEQIRVIRVMCENPKLDYKTYKRVNRTRLMQQLQYGTEVAYDKQNRRFYVEGIPLDRELHFDIIVFSIRNLKDSR